MFELKIPGLRLDATPVLLVAVVVQEDLEAEGHGNRWHPDPFSAGLSKLKDFHWGRSQWLDRLGSQFPQTNTSVSGFPQFSYSISTCFAERWSDT